MGGVSWKVALSGRGRLLYCEHPINIIKAWQNTMLVGSLGSEGRLLICLFSQEGQKQRLYLATVYKGRTKAVVVGPRIVMQG